jgi:hypothetical protein
MRVATGIDKLRRADFRACFGGEQRSFSSRRAVALLLMIAGSAQARDTGDGDRRCLVEVLHSEELPLGPLFHHTVKTILRVTRPDTPPFETTVYRVIPWQEPPPRRGQHTRVQCDQAMPKPPFGLF